MAEGWLSSTLNHCPVGVTVPTFVISSSLSSHQVIAFLDKSYLRVNLFALFFGVISAF